MRTGSENSKAKVRATKAPKRISAAHERALRRLYGGIPRWRCGRCEVTYEPTNDAPSPFHCDEAMLPVNAAAARWERSSIQDWSREALIAAGEARTGHPAAHDRRIVLRQMIAVIEAEIAKEADDPADVTAAIRASECDCVECRPTKRVAQAGKHLADAVKSAIDEAKREPSLEARRALTELVALLGGGFADLDKLEDVEGECADAIGEFKSGEWLDAGTGKKVIGAA